MDFRAVSDDGRGMSTSGNKLDRAELRLQRRYMTPSFEVIVECDLFRSLDVSMGGVHLDGGAPLWGRVGRSDPLEWRRRGRAGR